MKKDLSLPTLILIITTTVFSFSSMTTAFFMMGSKSLPWFLISGACYFIPYALIVAQYTKKYADRSGTIFDWLKESLSPKLAFITAALWYCSYFTWMVSLFMRIMIPFSILLFGKDISSAASWFGISSQIWVALLSILSVFLLTALNTRGFQVIVSFLKISSFAMVGLLILSLISNLLIISRHPAEFFPNIIGSIHADSFFTGTNNQFFSQLPFFIFSITAFGGLDTVASLADRTKKSKSRFPRAVIIAAVIITLLYFIGIILWSGANNLEALRQTNQMHLGNLMYGLMGTTAKNLAVSFNFSNSQTALLYQIFIRYTAFTLFVAYLSLLSSITFGPLKSLIQGTPKEIWPKKFVSLNSNQMPVNALWLQAVLVALVILTLSLNNQFLGNLYNQLTYMTNVARSIPYFVVAISFPFFIQKNIVSDHERLIQNKKNNYLLSISVCLCILLAIGFQIYQPFKLGNYVDGFSLIIGPIIFVFLSRLLYQRFERRQALQL
ncbi:amino acid permease [Enterococcus alishanensis]|uniref:Amino acid permease n=1 Tax=Enterococcus alishanensis TaxID=1303817 RepID=A0ABS6TAW7_9ENTE|nr:amino acid permease [Enterococcus alishanensis]MBV7390035.1 amino acid permease [Enterococcus alishanensis]